MDTNCKWTFAELSPNQYHNGPQDAMIEAFKDKPYAALIREVCQNSCDALAPGKSKVRVELSFGYLNKQLNRDLFDLREHIKGCLNLYPDDQNTTKVIKPMLHILNRQEIPYLRVSDYNTTGMSFRKGEGGKPKGSFYAFVRSGGHSEKTTSTAGGSFGFGKAAYFQISGLRSILVSTQNTQGENFFEGISSLCTHQIGSSYFDGHGFYDSNDGALPNCGLENIPMSFRRNEPGTDFYILGTNQDTVQAKEDMAKSVLRYFQTAVLDGLLEVDIDGILISKDTFDNVLDRFFPEEEDDAIRNHFYKLNPRPYVDAYRNAGNSVKYRIIEKELPILGQVKLYVNVAPKCNRDKIIYMRKNKMVIQTKMTGNHYGAYCLFICESEKGNTLLRKLENASHDKWDKSNYTEHNVPCREGIDALKEMEDFVQDSLKSIFDRETDGVIEIEGLSEFLSSSESLLDEMDAAVEQATDSLYGVPTGKQSENETGSQTSTSSGMLPDNQSKIASGIVTVEDNSGRDANETGDSESATTSPEKSDAGKKPREPKPKKPRNKKTANLSDTDGNLLPLTIQSRMIAQVSAGRWWHHLILHSSRDASKVRLFLKASGEDGASEVFIAEAIDSGGNSLYTAGNMIANVNLKQGKNVIRVRMEDNMKYTLIFDGYEA